MCLAPITIFNPDYKRTIDKWPLYRLGRGMNSVCDAIKHKSGKFFTGPSLALLSPKSVLVDRIDDYYAFNEDGEFCPIYIQVPCGKCLECKNHRAAELRSRMLLEASCYDEAPIFITLTYNDDNLPLDGVNEDHVKKFVRALHDHLRHQGLPHEFRHIFFSEYGSLRGRPHYHGIIFGYNFDFKRFISFDDIVARVWNKGFVKCEVCRSSAVFNYVSKYILKDSVVNTPDGKNTNFWIGSRRNGGGIGSPILNRFSLEAIKIEYPYITVKVLGRTERVLIPSSVRRKLNPCLSEILGHRLVKDLKSFTLLTKQLLEFFKHKDLSIPLYQSGYSISNIKSCFYQLEFPYRFVSPEYRHLNFTKKPDEYVPMTLDCFFQVYRKWYDLFTSLSSKLTDVNKRLVHFITIKRDLFLPMLNFVEQLEAARSKYLQPNSNDYSLRFRHCFALRTKDLQ